MRSTYFLMFLLVSPAAFCQSSDLPPANSPPVPPVQAQAETTAFGANRSSSTVFRGSGEYQPFSTVAVAAHVGLLGIGFETATPLSARFNLRAGADFFSYSDTITNDNIDYAATLRFRSVQASLDWFPWKGGFRVSPGALLYNGNQITGSATVQGGNTFTLNHVEYQSSFANPVTGTGSFSFNKAAPKITVGFGNMIPRSGRHFSVPVDLGFAYVGYPKVELNLNGTVCDPGGTNCRTIASDPTIQSNIIAQQKKIAHGADVARFYPIVSLGVAWRF